MEKGKKRRLAEPETQKKKASGPSELEAKAAADIDSLFGKLTEAKKQKKAKESAEQEEAKRPKIKIKKKKAPKEGTPLEGQGEDALQPGQRFDAKRDDLKAKPWKFDPTGMPIYDPESMKVGRGGNTALCPFDCNCCF